MEERLPGERDFGSSGDRTVEEGSTGSSYDSERGGNPPINAETPRRITDVNTYNVEIEGSGEVNTGASSGAPVPGGTPASFTSWDQARTFYRSRWEDRYGIAGRRWEDYEPAYRYGWERAKSPQYQGRAWSDVETDLRGTWESNHNSSPWERVAGAIRDAWESPSGGQDRTDTERAA